jgi:TRAP-type C4-dicarboxylate transport system substrate-binding protein
VQILPLPEVYIAIQQGLVDGQDNPIDTIWSNKFYEVAPYVTLTRHVYSPIPLAISEKTWQKLSPEDQRAIVRAAKEAADWTRTEVKSNEDRQLADMSSKGAKINSPDIQPFRDAVKPTYDRTKAKFGTEFDALMADVMTVRKALPVNK